MPHLHLGDAGGFQCQVKCLLNVGLGYGPV